MSLDTFDDKDQDDNYQRANDTDLNDFNAVEDDDERSLEQVNI